MAVTFQLINKTTNHRALVIMPDSDRVLLSFCPVAPTKKLSSDYLYAIKSSKLKNYKNLDNLSFLVLEDIPLPQEYFQTNGLNLIVTKDDNTFQTLKAEFQNLFDEQARINNYACQMMELCHQGAEPQKLIDTAYRMMKNPILLVDTNLALICSAGTYAGIEEPVINYCLKENHLPHSFLKNMMDDTEPKTDSTYPDLLLLEKNIHDYLSTSIIAGRIVHGTQLLGYIKVFEYNHPITELEKSYMVILCHFMSLTLTDYLSSFPSNNVRIEDFMADLLSKRIYGRDAIDSRAFLYNLDTSQELYVITIKYDPQTSNTDRLYHLKKQLIGIFHLPTIIFYDQMIVMLVPKSHLTEHQTELIQFLQKHNLLAGKSLPFSSYADAPKHYSQTLACLEIQSRFQLTDLIIDYNEWKTTHIFLHLQECCDLKDLIPPEIRILQTHDQTRGTNLVETLFSYVHHRQNITEAATELHLHYNTMKYRINQIIELTNINFDDYEFMFNIIIAEKVFDILRRDVTCHPAS